MARGACHIAMGAQVTRVFFELTAHELNTALVGTFDRTEVTSRQMCLGDWRIRVSRCVINRKVIAKGKDSDDNHRRTTERRQQEE